MRISIWKMMPKLAKLRVSKKNSKFQLNLMYKRSRRKRTNNLKMTNKWRKKKKKKKRCRAKSFC